MYYVFSFFLVLSSIVSNGQHVEIRDSVFSVGSNRLIFNNDSVVVPDFLNENIDGKAKFILRKGSKPEQLVFIKRGIVVLYGRNIKKSEMLDRIVFDLVIAFQDSIHGSRLFLLPEKVKVGCFSDKLTIDGVVIEKGMNFQELVGNEMIMSNIPESSLSSEAFDSRNSFQYKSEYFNCLFFFRRGVLEAIQISFQPS
jgi:hypothetical protein